MIVSVLVMYLHLSSEFLKQCNQRVESTSFFVSVDLQSSGA